MLCASVCVIGFPSGHNLELVEVSIGQGRTYIGGRVLGGLDPGAVSPPETHSNKSVSLFMNHDHKNFQFAAAAHDSIGVFLNTAKDVRM